jgi:hypothetical protein
MPSGVISLHHDRHQYHHCHCHFHFDCQSMTVAEEQQRKTAPLPQATYISVTSSKTMSVQQQPTNAKTVA